MNKDQTSAYINVVGLIIFLVLCPILVIQAISLSSGIAILFSFIYLVSMFAFWPIQIVYHLLLVKDNYNSTLQRVDRGSMLILIASIFSPVVLEVTTPIGATVLIIFFWVVVIVGMILLLTIENLSRHLAPIVAFSMGIVGMIVIFINVSELSANSILFFILGSASLLVAGIVYVLKKPDPKPEIFGFHEIFHILILIGTVLLHFLTTASILTFS